MANAPVDVMELSFSARPHDASYWGSPPTPQRRAELLAVLPDSVARTLTDLLDGRITKGAERYAALPSCFKDLGYPQLGSLPSLLPEELSPEWRALLELSTSLPRIIPASFATPIDVWNLRRWLGLDPPGRLEQPIEPGGPPLWRVLARPASWSVLKRLPLPQRIEAFCEGSLRGYRLSEPALEDLGKDELCSIAEMKALGDPGVEAAPAMAEFLLRWSASPDCYGSLVPGEARIVVLLAAAAGQLPFAPAWDHLYTLEFDRKHDVLKRIPAERRASAIESGVRGVHPYYAEKAILRALPLVPDARLLALLKSVGRGGGGNPKRVIADELERIGDQHPAVAALLGNKPPPKPHAITLRAVPMPPPGTPLPKLVAEQVSIPDDSRHLYNLFTAHAPDGKHLYDLSLFCWDDGPIYKAGTRQVVGHFVQGSAECKNAKLAEDLDTALHRFRAGLDSPKAKPAKKASKRPKKAPVSKKAKKKAK